MHQGSITRGTQPERNPSATSRLRDIEGQFKSDIVLEVCVLTRLPPINDTMISSYTVNYKVDYGRVQGKWTEQLIKTDYHKSKLLSLEYIYGSHK